MRNVSEAPIIHDRHLVKGWLEEMFIKMHLKCQKT